MRPRLACAQQPRLFILQNVRLGVVGGCRGITLNWRPVVTRHAFAVDEDLYAVSGEVYGDMRPVAFVQDRGFRLPRVVLTAIAGGKAQNQTAIFSVAQFEMPAIPGVPLVF